MIINAQMGKLILIWNRNSKIILSNSNLSIWNFDRAVFHKIESVYKVNLHTTDNRYCQEIKVTGGTTSFHYDKFRQDIYF